MACRTRLKSFLDRKGISYLDIPHEAEYTSQETAEDTHTPGRKFAKTVVVRLNGQYALVVLPASRRLDLGKLKTALGVPGAELATEDEMRQIFPDSELGAEPPFGFLYGLPVVVTPDLAEDSWITFNAGTHEDAIRMKYQDFARLVRPLIVRCAPEGPAL
jgi:Ala-tRNA(Pro) deacylase